MKASGYRSERETIITFNDDSDQAEVWTASETVYRHLKKAGFELIEDNDRSAVFKLAKSKVKFRKSRILSPEKQAILAARGRAMAARRKLSGPA